jgi:hypothetical protein
MTKYLLLILLFSFPALASIDEKVAEISKKRMELERLNLDYQNELARIQQEKEILRDRIQETKNTQLKEKLKTIQIQQQMRSLSGNSSLEVKKLSISVSKSEFEIFHNEVQKALTSFSEGTFLKSSWREINNDLRELYRRGQYAAYQVKLTQLLEKLFFEANQVSFGFETIEIKGQAKTFEVVRFGHWLVMAKDPTGHYLFSNKSGFKLVDDSQGKKLFSVLPAIKAQSLNFIPQEIIDLKAEGASL